MGADESGAVDGLMVRRATDADRPAIIDVCRDSLGWAPEDPNEAFFSWKHDDNPFGASPAWLAVTDTGRIAGVRVFLRWRFRTPGGDTISAVRAVDTATHPDFQGKGIFTTLTLGALPELGESGVQVVFNTPNDKSRPGYLKMGWQEVGRVPVAVRMRGVGALRRVAGARAAAEKWSTPTDAGADAPTLLADHDAVERLLARLEDPSGIATDRSAEYLSWRYSFAPLHYRALPLGDDLAAGVIVFRTRRRGAALELTVCEVLAPPGADVGRAVGHLLGRTGADYAIRCSAPGALRAGFLPAPRLGPILTWRPVTRPEVPTLGDLALTLGDVELF